MQLEKPQLFSSRKSLIVVLMLLGLIAGVRLLSVHDTYRAFVSKPFYFTYANVVSQKEKRSQGRRYRVLKLHSDEGLQFLTTSYQKISYEGKRLRLELFPDKSITFFGYMSTFFVRSKIKEITPLPFTFKERLLKRVALQHFDPAITSFYHAIFFAAPLDGQIRQKVALIGVSHLVALSGFHLTILWGLVYGVLLMFYRPLQQRFFPYRFSLIDVGAVTLLMLGAYVWLSDFPASLVRAYAMVIVGWLVLIAGMELMSFAFLLSVIFLLLALFPHLIASLSFGLSVAGVFMIYLIVTYTEGMKKRMIGYFILPIGIFILMQPIIHGIFGVTASYQIFSPLLSLVFMVFYPLAIGLHLMGYGGILDSGLQWLFDTNIVEHNHLLPWYVVVLYVGIGIVAMRSKVAFTFLCASATFYTGYLYLV